MKAKEVEQALNQYENPADAIFLQRYFKTGKGQYGEGDIFIGLRVPTVRLIAKKYQNLSLAEIENLLESPVHEHRLCAVIIMSQQAKRAEEELKKALYNLYLKRTDRINNWDLVDVSSRDVIGSYLLDKPRRPLYRLARSKKLWERRIAIISTAEFIRHNQLEDTFEIAVILMSDSHDLIHKAVGWMLREAGKKDERALKSFLDKYAAAMPRTMLRYSLERLEPGDRAHYMSLKVH